jgi:hypothetical protein
MRERYLFEPCGLRVEGWPVLFSRRHLSLRFNRFTVDPYLSERDFGPILGPCSSRILRRTHAALARSILAGGFPTLGSNRILGSGELISSFGWIATGGCHLSPCNFEKDGIHKVTRSSQIRSAPQEDFHRKAASLVWSLRASSGKRSAKTIRRGECIRISSKQFNNRVLIISPVLSGIVRALIL